MNGYLPCNGRLLLASFLGGVDKLLFSVSTVHQLNPYVNGYLPGNGRLIIIILAMFTYPIATFLVFENWGVVKETKVSNAHANCELYYRISLRNTKML